MVSGTFILLESFIEVCMVVKDGVFLCVWYLMLSPLMLLPCSVVGFNDFDWF